MNSMTTEYFKLYLNCINKLITNFWLHQRPFPPCKKILDTSMLFHIARLASHVTIQVLPLFQLDLSVTEINAPEFFSRCNPKCHSNC